MHRLPGGATAGACGGPASANLSGRHAAEWAHCRRNSSQLVTAGEQVMDVQLKLDAWVPLLGSERRQKRPNDAPALRSLPARRRWPTIAHWY
jgi:hypothetical protein